MSKGVTIIPQPDNVTLQYVSGILSIKQALARVTGSTLLVSANTSRNSIGQTPVKLKEILINKISGTFNVQFDMTSDDHSHNYARIYKNGVGYGTTRQLDGAQTQTFNEDLAFVEGDLAQIYVWGASTDTNVVVSNFRLYAKSFEPTVNTD